VNVLVFLSGRERIKYVLFKNGRRISQCAGFVPGNTPEPLELAAALEQIQADCAAAQAAPDVLATMLPYGGELFREPVVVDEPNLEQLQGLLGRAPLHLPRTLALLTACRQVFPGTPAVLAFGSSFFVDLPLREQRYALDSEKIPELRRFGYHGLFHQAACDYVLGRRRREGRARPRILSLCLENQPEAAAVIGRTPVMVTSGATPLEGLPGATSCGELDGGIVLALVQQLEWGPEQINRVLTQESGLLGLTGRAVTLKDVFTSTADDVALAREVMEYRFALVTGAAAAAMGGLDAIVFSGRWAAVGSILGPCLLSSLPAGKPPFGCRAAWHCLHRPLERILADVACAQWLRQRAGQEELSAPASH
jgi:acetate kinase